MSAWAKGMAASFLVMASLGFLPAAASATASCGHVTYQYRVGSGRFNAIFAGLNYHAGIDARGLSCHSARSFVAGYARTALRQASGRNDFRAPRFYAGFRCTHIRDGDDSGRNLCRRHGAHIFFSDSTGQFA